MDLHPNGIDLETSLREVKPHRHPPAEGGSTLAAEEEHTAGHEPVTAWHPMLVALLEEYLPSGWKLLPEFLLGRLPQRVDILVLQMEGTAAGSVRKLHSIFDYLRPHTLIEHKGPTDDLAGNDATVLLGYAFQYMALQKLEDPADVGLMVIGDSITRSFVKQVERFGGQLDPVGGGLWHGNVHKFQLHGVATREAYQAAPSERLLYTFSRSYLQAPAALLSLDEEEERVYLTLYEHVEQFRKRRGPMAMKDEEKLQRAHKELVAGLLRSLSPEGLSESLAGIPTEQRLAGIPTEQRLAGIPAEQRLAGIPAEQRLLALTDEALAAFPDDYLRSLSPETQTAIRKRIGRP
jgi:hypothetical protein